MVAPTAQAGGQRRSKGDALILDFEAGPPHPANFDDTVRRSQWRAGARRIGKLSAALLALALANALGACSKCDVPVYMPKSCHAGPDTTAPR